MTGNDTSAHCRQIHHRHSLVEAVEGMELDVRNRFRVRVRVRVRG